MISAKDSNPLSPILLSDISISCNVLCPINELVKPLIDWLLKVLNVPRTDKISMLVDLMYEFNDSRKFTLALIGIRHISNETLISVVFFDKNNKFNEFTRFLLNMIPFIITILVFNFAKEINIKSVGMTAIWGIFGFAYTFMTSLLLLKNKNTRKNGVEKNEK